MKPAHNEHLFFEELRKGYFRIDDDGRIWRIAKRVNQYKTFVNIIPKEMKYVNNNGYIRISFSKNGKKYHCSAHRLVWIYFKGEILFDMEVNHKNGIKTYNHPKNLELSTSSENTKHAFNTGLGKIGEKHGMAKLTETDVLEIRKRYLNGEKQKYLVKEFNVSKGLMSKIVNRKTWRHVK